MLNAGLRSIAKCSPMQIAVVHGATKVTYGELEESANRFAQIFRERGLVRGDHLACLLPNGPEILCLAWAAYRSGLYLTPIPSTLAPPEAAYIINNCEASIVISHTACRAVAELLPSACEAVKHWLSLGGLIAHHTAAEQLLGGATCNPIEDETPGALMLYTSGTTGTPKGVWRPLLPPDYTGQPPFARDLLELFELGGSGVRYLSPAPLYHAAPLRTCLAVTAGGGTVFIMDRFDAEEALRLIESEKITVSQWVPTMFQRLLALPEVRRKAHQAPAHRMAFHAAAPCPDATKRSMIDWWGPILLEYYAGTEGVGATAINSHEWLSRPGSVGKALRGSIHILDDSDVELPADSIGRIFFSGHTPFSYFNDPQKTRSRTSRQNFQTLGDIGRVDDEGYLYLTDRSDDMIISGGVNIYPQEIEAVIIEVPGVADCCVVGIANERFGETPVAFVVPTPEGAKQPELLLKTILDNNHIKLGRPKHPSEIHLCQDLPRTPTGKLLRRKVRELASEPKKKSH